ncbi:uncharacterized protein LOC107042195 [Diachasma alloeum]|uniref:uncharacterized protein LOC107042195 n=1 Tax=Diachasma alloeum TaxID=454923 RepID=UPI0007381357|nr:uncharacterized protein LOC107042195 [Diachasma alloeum]
MERKNRFSLHIVILSLALILVDLSTTVECLRRSSRKRNVMRRADSDSFIPPIEAKSERETVNSTVTCALSLAERHVEVCELAWKIDQLQEMLPHLQSLIANRLGKRKFSFTVYINKPSSIVELVDVAGQAVLRSIGKFVQFLGYVQKLFDATVGGGQIPHEPGTRKSLYGNSAEDAGFSDEIRDIHSVDEGEVQHLIKKAWSRKCVLELLKTNKDLCDVVSRIDALEALLQGHPENSGSRDSQVLPIKLYSENLNLTDFLDAIHDGLVLAMTHVPDIPTTIDREVVDATSIQSGRKLMNEQGQEVKEVFETSDYKVELMKPAPKYRSASKKKNVHNAKRRFQQKVVSESKESSEERIEPLPLANHKPSSRGLSESDDAWKGDSDDGEDYWNSADSSSEEVVKQKALKSARRQVKGQENGSRKFKKYLTV